MKKLFLSIIYCLLLLSVQAQVQDYATTKEKVYLQTDHVYFVPGDTLFYKAYVVDALKNTPTLTSTILNVDIISPAGSVLAQLKHPISIGYCEGGYKFSNELPGGIYKIKAYTTWMQNEKDSTWFTRSVTLQKVIAPRLLLKLDFPEKGYGPGDTIRANYSARTPDNQPLRNYTGQFNINIEGKLYKTDNFKTDTAGKATIRAVLPATLNSSDGLLNVTINHSGFTESISRSIPIVLNYIDLQFMPEGGTFVEGLPTVLAFKAINEFGKPVDVKGTISDDKGQQVATFASYHGGMGSIPFTPVAGRKYHALVMNKKYPLPLPASNGIVLNMLYKNGQLYAKISTTAAEDITLTGTVREHVYYTTNATLHTGAQLIKIDTADFPTGIARFTLRDSRRLKIAERVIFLNKYNVLHVNLTTDKATYQPREKVTMTLTTTNATGQAIPANMSLAVIDDKLWTMADDKQDHILSWLLMSSELRGKIEEPQFYFKPDEPKADSALDMLMLTQGYRYFAFTDIVNSSNRLAFTPDKLNILSGVITDSKGRPVKSKLYLFNINKMTGVERTTAPNGQFFFSDVDPGSKYCLMGEAENHRDSLTITVSQNGIGFNKQEAGMFKPLRTGLKESVAAYPSLVINNDKWAKDSKGLNEVVVTASVMKTETYTMGCTVTTVQDGTIGATGSFAAVLYGKAAGVKITAATGTPGDGTRIQIRGLASLNINNTPLYVIDGVPTQLNDLGQLNANDIESLTIFKDATATALYGSRGAYGVILVTTKDKRYADRIRMYMGRPYNYTVKNIKTPDSNEIFSQVPVFYTPKYLTPETNEKNDFRETIYWNPTIQTDKNGKAKVEFYNSDANTTFRAITEGIGYNGTIGRTEQTYAVHDAVSVDAKIPPYINAGDKVKIPVVLKNYGASDIVAHVRIQLPRDVDGDTTIKEVPVTKNGNAQLYMEIKPRYAMSGNIRINVNNQSIFLPFTVEEKAFPIHIVYAGNQSKDTSFTFSDVAGNFNPEMSLELHTVSAQLMDGIKSMLREPYGCFEQTSSSTYPNILILQLLNNAAKRDHELEKTARGMLERGYDKLVKFETAENGFEWFGHSPAHVALTAYGLMEFTAMKEFIPVDKGMLNRTERFLLDHRDGKGAFKPSPGGYDQFRAVPPEVANAYIVYALSQTDAGKHISLEYETTLKAAQASNDGYQLAIMALAADNLHKTADFNDLMQRLDKLFKDGQVTARTTVVGSQGISLYVETMSLYAMALMREPAPRKARIAQLMAAILSKKSYYGFGSTQGTIMALTAMVTYSKMDQAGSDDKGVFTLNGHVISSGGRVATTYLSNKNNFSVNYLGQEGIPYTFRCDYFTNTPPTSDKAVLKFQASLASHHVKMGETVRMNINVTNTSRDAQGMAVVKLGIPGGLSLQPWQLKELMDKEQVAYYEIFDNYLVFYWRGMEGKETKKIALDLKVDVPGWYQGKAGTSYLYYQPEDKYWQPGEAVDIIP